MDQYRENIVRGTPDFPFARYRLTSRQASAVFNHIHWHPEIEILYMQHGSAEVRTGKRYFQFNQGDLAFIHPNELHAIRPLGANCRHTAFVFSLDLVTLPDSHFFQTTVIQPLRSGFIRLPQHITVGDPLCTSLRNALDRICECDSSSESYKLTVFESILSVFFLLSGRIEQTAEKKDPQNETVKLCIRYMEDNYKNSLSLALIAEHAHLHPNYLCKLFRSYTGQTVFAYLNRLRIDHAAMLLRSTNLSVTQIAAECGFDSISFFTRKFKALMGITPKQYSMKFFEGIPENAPSK